MKRACIECPEVYDGGLVCPACGAPGEPLDGTPDPAPSDPDEKRAKSGDDQEISLAVHIFALLKD